MYTNSTFIKPANIRRGKRTGWDIAVLFAALLAMSLLLTPQVMAAEFIGREIDFNIPAQPLSGALLAFSTQTGLQVITAGTALDTVLTPPIIGRRTIQMALNQLLSGTHLKYRTIGETTVTLISAGPGLANTAAQSNTSPVSDQSAQSDSTHLHWADADQTGSAVSGGGQDASVAAPQLAEVVVTAQKRDENLLQVPVPVTAISADTLVQSNLVRFQDYVNRVPGLQVVPDDSEGVGASTLVIRGVTTGGYSNPTVGITVDDVPYGSSTSLGGGAAAPDLDPSDLARIEVLRGPQGTLYGASSFGGLVKFVTLDPSIDAFSGHVEAAGSDVKNGANLGYGFRAGVNVPVDSTLAIRASVLTRQDPGYIDNVITGQTGVNRTTATGGRLSGLWVPSDTVSLKLSALYQHAKQDGSQLVEPSLGDLKQAIVTGGGGLRKDAPGLQRDPACETGPGGLYLTHRLQRQQLGLAYRLYANLWRT